MTPFMRGKKRRSSSGTVQILSNAQPAVEGVGLATEYPGDIGIETDPDVLFVEMFEEADKTTLAANWTDYSLNPSAFSSDVPSGSPGTQSLALTQQRTDPAATGTLFKNLGGQGTSPLYVRAYFKYPSTSNRPDHSGIWVGGNAPELAFAFVPPGTRPPTTDTAGNDNWFSAGAEVVDATYRIDHYNYWPEMHADGVGDYWGNFLLNNPAVTITPDEWFCMEVMVKPNNPTTAFNGEHAIWINGVKVSHCGPGFPNGTWSGNRFTQDAGGTPFEGFKWTPDTMIFDTLDLNWVWLQCYNGTVNSTIYVDHFVVARRYIGPLVPASGFYVSLTGNDANTGTEDQPWQTIKYALTQATAGQTIWVRGGTYSANLHQGGSTAWNSGTSFSNAITIRAFPGESVSITAQLGYDYTTDPARYHIWQDIRFVGSHNGNVYLVNTAHHIRFQNCEISGAAGQGVQTDTTAHHCEWIGGTVYNNGFDLDAVDPGLYHGFYIQGPDNLLDGVDIYSNAGYGVQIYNGGAGTADRNVIRNCSVHDNSQTGYSAGGFTLGGGDDILIYNNLIYNNHEYGIGWNASAVNAGVYFNVIYGHNSVGVDIAGGASGNLKNNIIYSNSTNIQGSGPTQSNNVTTNPTFVNAGAFNFHLTAGSTNCINQGVAITGITTDKDGVTRGNPPEIGAYEI
jgi:hypothetical protein